MHVFGVSRWGSSILGRTLKVPEVRKNGSIQGRSLLKIFNIKCRRNHISVYIKSDLLSVIREEQTSFDFVKTPGDSYGRRGGVGGT